MYKGEFSIKQDIAFVRILVPFALGIVALYGYHSNRIVSYLMLINAFLFLQMLYLSTNRAKRKIKNFTVLETLSLQLLLFFNGCLCVTLYNDYINTDYYAFKNSKYLKIRIIDEPRYRQNIILFTAQVTKSAYQEQGLNDFQVGKYNFQPVSGKIKVTWLNKDNISMKLGYGDEFIIPSKFSETPAPANPSEFDFKSWLAMQNIYHQTILESDELLKLNTNTGYQLIHYAFRLRERQVDRYRKLIKSDDAHAVASTLILGYRAELSPEIMEIYSKTGTIHVLSVSGMHVGLVYLVLSRLLFFLNANQTSRTIKAGLILGVIWFYSLLTGFSPSVLRAAVMISVFMMAKLFHKPSNHYNVIAFAAFCLLLYNPFLIRDVGFQLSFMAVLGLIYLQPKIEHWLQLETRWLARIWSLVAMSLAAQLATYPFSVYYFHQFPIYFLLSNLFITLPSALMMYAGIILLVFNVDGLGPFLEWLINFTNAGLTKIAALPYSGITAIWLSKAELTLLCLSLLLFTIACTAWKKRLLIYSLVLFMGFQCLICYDKLKAARQKKTITFVLKNNYAIALISSRKAILFTDLNPGSKAFSYYIKPALDQHRITQMSFLNVNVTCVLKDNLIFDQLN